MYPNRNAKQWFVGIACFDFGHYFCAASLAKSWFIGFGLFWHDYTKPGNLTDKNVYRKLHTVTAPRCYSLRNSYRKYMSHILIIHLI